MDIALKEQQILSGLKDFQRMTTERVFSLFLEGKNRVLVADEVGLGKTLIAKGVIAKTARYHKEALNDDLFKVVYICSNQNIAGQNLSKLKINDNDRIDTLADTRLSMQHLRIFEDEVHAHLHNHYLQLIPLTPNTSFSMTGGSGSVNERALIFAILRHYRPLLPYLKELELLLKANASYGWDHWAKSWYDEKVQKCDDASGGKYLTTMLGKLDGYFKVNADVLSDVIEFCIQIHRTDSLHGSYPIIHKLRRMMALISVEMLNADLVIMDEFQRFPELINSNADSETAILANKFLNSLGQDEHKVKVLLLSATPYKLYSTLEEMNENQQDEHYREFIQVVNFLFENHNDLKTEFKQVWSDYSASLHEIGSGDLTILAAKKDCAENVLYQGISRTERLSVKGANRFFDTLSGIGDLEINEGDIHSYVQADLLLQEIGLSGNVPIDYVKSSPYLLSFMEHYKLKENVFGYFRKHPEQINIANKPALWLQEHRIAAYEPLADMNARFSKLKKETMPANAEKLLWIPPSRPYYEGGGPYTNMKHFSKALVFSSWEMVPRAIAALLSYEAERLTVGQLVKQSPNPNRENRSYFPPKNKARFPSPRLKFNMREGTPGAMTLLSLLYPSITLAKLYNPIEALNAGMNRVQIEESLRLKIDRLLEDIPYTPNDIGHDDRWYSLAPLLLDLQEDNIRNWLQQPRALWEFNEEDEEADDQDDQGAMEKHFEELRQTFMTAGTPVFGRKPRDLTDILVKMAMGSPAICAMRVFGVEHAATPALSARLAKTIVDRFNMQESTSIVELCYGSDQPHWQSVLQYCVDGNLQSVLDEYAHILIEENGLVHSAKSERATKLCERMTAAFRAQTASYNVDTFRKFRDRVMNTKEESSYIRMRSGYAAGFYDVKTTDKSLQRKDRLRLAFNSPFRPFVLATTSIGQEGLDFHFYCRKIVHWNLPSNPIDLEQREGRINRYKCLAIRQNIAHKYGNIRFSSDLWNEMFQQANIEEKKDGQPELVPFWCLPEDVPIKIERIVPMYPLSRDQAKYNRLIKILSLYRLSLGQARQEELLEYVLRNEMNEDQIKDLFINLSPYYKEASAALEVGI